MPGSWHVGVRLPDGRMAWADHDENVVTAMRKVNRNLANGKPPADADLAEVARWLDQNAPQSEACRAGQCDHT